MNPDASTPCVFIGGTLDGKKQGRMLRGYVPATLMEPIYEPAKDKEGSLLYKNITHRQLYVHVPGIDLDGAPCYRFDCIEERP